MARADLIGQVLDDRYRVLERVGEGAMGSVYRAERVKLGRIVAIKVMKEALQDAASRQRFEREALAMAKLEHPHCASVVDVGVHGEQPYVVMEFITGKTLRQLLEGGALPIPRAVDIVRQILSGLAHAHEHGVIHRDIKPANIVLSQKSGLGDHVKILDFGLARFNKEASNLTAGMVLGTPNYMAPEQIKGAALDHRIDVYACGVVLFELLTGHKPFRSESNDPVAVCMMHLNTPPPRLADLAPGSSFGPLEDVVARALAKDPDQRFQTAEELSHALADAATRVAAPPAATTRAATAPPALTPGATMPIDPDLALEPTASVTSLGAAAPAEPRVTAPTVAARPPRASGSSKRLAFASIGVAAAAIVAIVIATRGNASTPTTASADPKVAASNASASTSAKDRGAKASPAPAPKATPAPEPEIEIETEAPADDAVSALVAKATELAGAGRRDAAIDVLIKARKTYPRDARLPYHAAKIYLDKMWWADGLKQARAAIQLDERYRSDPDLIKLVVRGFNTTKHVDYRLAGFLRKDIGANAKPYLEDTAQGHPNPIVRARAKAELEHYK